MPPAARHWKDPGKLILGVFLAVLQWVSVLTGIALGVLMLTGSHEDKILYGPFVLGCLILLVLLILLRYMHGRKCSCPLCHGPILLRRKCNMHRDARKYPLISYRQSLIVDTVTRGRFTCMYCGTPFRLRR